MSKNFLSGHRKWNTLAFRGRLMSLLAPARGMSTLPAKGGFSRPSSFTHSGVSPRPHLPPGQGRLRQRYIARRKRFFLFQGVSHIPFAWIGYLDRSQRFALLFESIRFTLFIHNPKHCIVDWNGRRRLLGLRTARPTENICGNSMSLETPECEAHGGSSHARGKRPPAVEINSSSTQPNRLDFLSYFEL